MAIPETTPRKSLGQHWLHDDAALDAMCAAADIDKNDLVLEIGPGLGTLTKKLVTKAKRVVAVELDEKLATGLTSRVAAQNLDSIKQDILQFDFTQLVSDYKIVANIPYYLTSNLIRVISETTNPPMAAVMLIQKEVAERVAARPGDMSLLAVSTQFYWNVSLGRKVLAKLFTPPPKVDSQILILKRPAQPLFPDVDTKQFFHLVRAGFSQKRKTLENSLSGGLSISKTQARELLEAANITPTTRAQALTLDSWHKLYVEYVEHR